MSRSREKMAYWASTAASTLRSPPHAPGEREAADRERRRESRFGAALDFASDLGVLAFAVWTLIAYVGMATEARVSLLVPLWLATVPLVGVALFVLSRQRDGLASPKDRDRASAPAGAFRRRLLMASLAGGLISAVLAATVANAVWALVWAGAFAAVAFAVGIGRLRSEGPVARELIIGFPAHAFAAFAGLVFAGMSLFINRPNGDDAFYVNRATGTAQLNHIPVRDIIFTDEQAPPVSGTGLPVDSFSALQGAFARLIDVHAASVAYYVTPPLMTFLATWALWRLLRAWAPRNLLLCFVLGCVYWTFSAQDALTPGSYFLNRMWQGKVIFVAWLVLTAYVFFTRWLARRDALTAVLLLAVGVGSIGMTASAAFVAPLLFGTAALPLLARRDWWGLPVLIAAAAFPFLVGVVATEKYPLVSIFGQDPSSKRFLGTPWYFHEVFGVGVVAAITLIGLWAAPWLARVGPPTRLATSIALLSMLLLAPGVLPALNDLTDLTTILRRVLWFIPFPAIVGLLGAVPVAELLRRLAGRPAWARRLAVAAPALLVAGLLGIFGNPVWISWRFGSNLWVERPVWKMQERPLKNARAILRNYQGSGAILVEEHIMRALALITVRPKVVNARSFYARFTPEPRQRTRYRLALTRFVIGERPTPSRDTIRRALSDLNVGLVCVNESRPLVIREVETIGYREAFQVRKLVCLEGSVTSVAAARGSSAQRPVSPRRMRS